MTSRLVFGQISRYHGLFKSSHKVNLHSNHEVLTLLALSNGLCTLWAEQMSKYDSFSVQCFPKFLCPQSGKLTAFPTICVFPLAYSDPVLIVVFVAVVIILNTPCSLFGYLCPFSKVIVGRILNGTSVVLSSVWSYLIHRE